MKSRPDHRRALRVMVSFCFCFVALCAASEIWLRAEAENLGDVGYSIRRDHLANRVAAHRQKDPATPLVIMLGSSRVHNGLDAQWAEEQLQKDCGRPVCVANFGVPGGGPWSSMVVLGRLLREGLKPDVVLIEIMPVYLPRCDVQLEGATPLSTADCQWLAENGLVIEDPTDDSLLIHTMRTSLLRAFAPKLLPRGMNPNWARNGDAWGANLVHEDASPERRAFLHEAVGQVFSEKLCDFELHDEDMEGLRLVLSACRKHQISAALVMTPEGPHFRSLYREGAQAEMAARFERVADEYGVPLVHGWEWLVEEDFLDSHHMLAQGARKFTSRLCRETVSPLLEEGTYVATDNDGPSVRR